jgi:CubicO group peptidase (beta-lactamase class C family)
MAINGSSVADAHVLHVERGLLPETTLLSDSARPASIAERMAHHRVPGLSLAVIGGYQVAWARGYGVRALGADEPVTPETRFQAASISKPVAAAAALRLVAEGRLELDADINHKLVGWKIPANGPWQPRVTLRQLLSHSAGLTVHGFPGYGPGDPVPTLTQVLDGAPPANTPPVRVNLIPGTQARYSGGGYTVLQQLLCDVTGLPFAELMQQLVLGPLGMSSSTYAQPLPAALHGDAAVGHEMRGRGPIAGGWHTYPEQAAAGLWTTPSDLARFFCELALAQAGRSARLLPQELAAAMVSPQTAPHQGLGIFLGGEGEDRWAGHSGSNEGYICDATIFLDRGFGAVAMTNGQNGDDLVPEVFRSIASEYGWPNYLPRLPEATTLAESHLRSLAGSYQLPGGHSWALEIIDGTLHLRPHEQQPIALVPKGPSAFFATVVNAEVTFEAGDDGTVTSLTIQQDGQELRATRSAQSAAS